MAPAYPIERWHGPQGYEVSTDPERLDLDFIHGFLRTAYWSPGVAQATVERAIGHSLVFGLYAPSGQPAGFARVVTDYAVYAYVCDLFVAAEHRGAGQGKFLVSCLLAHSQLQGLRRWALATSDAHGLYERFAFAPPAHPERHLFIERPLPAEVENAPAPEDSDGPFP
jgi:GNAT superfamily N-acetyltransferase